MEISVVASGSNGNSILVEGKDTSILFDAGKSGKEIEKRLSNMKKSAENIDAILTTHEHRDHIASIGVLSRRYNIPIYMTKPTYASAKHIIGNINKRKTFDISKQFRINNLNIKPIKISHDASDPCGFMIKEKNKSFGIITDSGHITIQIKDAIKHLNGVLIESNHDIDMLLNGPYPYYLKNRILNNQGHLSNVVASQLINDNATDKLKTVILGHLSGNNNTPKLAQETFENIAKKIIKNIDYCTASRDKETGCFNI